MANLRNVMGNIGWVLIVVLFFSDHRFEKLAEPPGSQYADTAV